MSEYTDCELQQLHIVLCELLDYIVDVCNKNNIMYFLSGGTALGATRHKGFIPWDDDIDIGLKRDEYEKLIRILKKPNEKYVLQNDTNEKNYFVSFSKLRKKGTTFIDEDTKGLFDNNGIFVDIFVFDKVRDVNSIAFRVRYGIIRLINHMFRMKYCVSNHSRISLKDKVDIKISSLLIGILKKRTLLHIQKKLITWDNNIPDSKVNYYIEYTGPYKFRNAYIKSSWINTYGRCEFAGKEYMCANDMNSYLSNIYGANYMDLPPIEKRETHKPIVLKFDNDNV